VLKLLDSPGVDAHVAVTEPSHISAEASARKATWPKKEDGWN
jgi:hypothetical protein